MPLFVVVSEDYVVINSKEEKCTNISGASFISTCFNGLNALLGVGLLSIPYALVEGGWLSLILLLVIASLTFYTGLLIQRCMDTNPTIRSYPDIGNRAFGKTGEAIVSITMDLELYLVATGFLILEGDNLSNLFPDMDFGYHIDAKSGFIVLVALIILPTIWLHNMNILSYISASGVIASMIILGSVFWDGAVLFLCFAFSTVTYSLMAVIGYLMYGSNVESQITLNLPTNNISSRVAICTTLITPIAKYALMLTLIFDSIEA
ncbi:putative amino acid transporter, transmembrane domain-containing protein [Helianthus annuus]|uniref:Amino acid transporter, transmembrane domain-containing protein n=1 Tax=Helianthus annuus TaxID=4232 RepID=A0A251TXP1_HELAN|nr:putative amino acid transporter, transmembrane domain-containing protein [Helianthus annuus]KAJ0527034.1 putative amino acid transporter, transmembrane domain-containing protein [Helianthus annuus]KAJ0535632.1 putative amino acid transporter, transmembrane domain-containing protein [Helianthus annuus]KAJ0543434.1 putative amino acid transporter, transmembrane domain-containing protein [Helianthus annuus]KAJ0708486.1 putative amino acid transporter, transmembrane domain-containing protein [He